MKTRRDFLIMLGAGALAVPLTPHAQQQGKVWRVGILSVGNRASNAPAITTFIKGLSDLGYVERKNLVIDARYADGNRERLSALAKELVQSKVDAILANSSLSVQATRLATQTIPIVMTGVGNPVGSGFVASLARPGGNITGLSNVSIEVSSKYLELLHAAVPKLSRVAILINPAHPNHPTVLKQVQTGAQRINVKVVPYEVRTIGDFDRVLAEVMRDHPGGLIVPTDPAFPMKYHEIAELALKHRLPTLFGSASGVEAGALLGYVSNSSDMFVRAAAMVDKIFKGTRPADIPVELPTRFELAVNLKTAKALGITIPQTIMVRADRVIE